MVDMINHPPHYTSSPSGIECIEIAEQLPFCLGNCYKYLHRAGLKGDELTDLNKALFYANRAYINDETLPDSAKELIFKVASHSAPSKQLLLDSFAKMSAGAFVLYLSHVINYANSKPAK